MNLDGLGAVPLEFLHLPQLDAHGRGPCLEDRVFLMRQLVHADDVPQARGRGRVLE